jgi:hypothetical protein
MLEAVIDAAAGLAARLAARSVYVTLRSKG